MRLEYEDFKKILNIGINLSTGRDRNEILASILESGMEVTNCDASTLYLYENDKLTFKIMKTLSMGISRGVGGEAIDMPPVAMKEENVCAYTAIHREIVNIPDVYDSDRFDFSGPKQYDSLTGYHTKSQLVIPLENNENELIGVLQLINAMDKEGNVIPFDKQFDIIIRSLGSMAAIELTNLTYMEELKAQLYSFVEALTTVLDERSPYNASHTRNVAKYSQILADYISELHQKGQSEEFFDQNRKEKLLLAALLHDIGKIVVPLGVMDKATRLGDELAKVEERFELLESLYEVDMLRGRITEEEYREQIADLKADLAFIHKIDAVGYLDNESYDRVSRISLKKHIKENGKVTKYITDKEKNCLSIRQGTLTVEEREVMKNHVVVTEKILSKVRFNKNFAIVPKWAASHHEFLNGTGYPKHLTAKELDLETRILTVADIYDALTAIRPYKNAIPDNKSITMLRNMAEEGKVDGQIVEWLSEALKKEV
ncbi:MAG: HD domain-containing protein [Lachnospiraceae bacterium]|jgi:HD-GYP domain|nr:HD domain-containing protein [Lachnospiraceae bacterium]